MKKRYLVLFLICILLSSMVLPACGGGGDSDEVGVGGLSDVTLWGMPGTEKVYQNIDKNSEYYKDYKTDAKIDIMMAKGEYEGGQIIISADKDCSYEVTSSNLTSGDNVIAKENVEVFVQKYINVTANHDSSSGLPIARYPDALIPMQNLKNVGENLVKAGENQGIYVRVKTSVNQAAGVYQGSLTVKIGKESTNVPVKVTVDNVVVSEENHTKSVFLNGWYFFEGELDTSQEMFEKYNDALLDYRLCSSMLFYGEHHMEDVSTPEKLKAWVEKAYAYMQDPRCSTINMPYEKSGSNISASKMTEILQAVLDYSIENNYNMFKKLVWYGGFIDEPRFNGIMDMARTVSGTFTQTKNDFAKSVVGNAAIEAQFRPELAESIKSIPNVVTDHYDAQLANLDATLCPQFQYYDSAELRSQYDNQTEKWWYGCIAPRAPYPTYHIDDTWLSARVVSWMQAEYNVVGNLFWATDVYASGANNKYQSLEDYYEGNAARYPNVNGDGYLFYPGKKYGVDGPLGSMRLEAIRDGLEEYEILYAIKQNYAEVDNQLSDYRSNFESFVHSISSAMYSGTTVAVTSKEFNEARASLFEFSKINQKTDFSVIEYSDNGNGKVTYNFAVNKDWTVKANGKELTSVEKQGNLAIYSVIIDLDQAFNALSITCEKGGEKYECGINLGGKVVVKLGSEINTKEIERTTVSPKYEVIGSDLKITLPNVIDPDIVEQAIALVGSNIDAVDLNTKKIVLFVYYDGDDKAELTLTGKFAKSKVNSELTIVKLNKGVNEIVIDLSAKNMQLSGELEKLIFSFYKKPDDKRIDQHIITIKSIAVYSK